MSASSSVISRGLRRILQALRLTSRQPVVVAHLTPSGMADVAARELSATIEIVSLIGNAHVAPILTPAMEVAPESMPEAASAPSRRATLSRPLACQLAYTASRNVPKGRKARPVPLAVSSGKRALRSTKAKPIVRDTVKKAPKRRHVWLCNQVRVIRPASLNVVPLNAARVRTIQKPGSQKTVRLLKIAA